MTRTTLAASITIAALAATPAHAAFIITSVERSVRVETYMYGFSVPEGTRHHDANIAGPAGGQWTEDIEHGDTVLDYSIYARSQQSSLVSGDTISGSVTALASRTSMPSRPLLSTDVHSTSRVRVHFELTVPTLVEIQLSGSTIRTGEYDYASRTCGVSFANGPHVLWIDEGVLTPLSLVTVLPPGQYVLSSIADAWYQNTTPGPAVSMERTSNASIRIVPSPGIAAGIISAAAILGFRRRRRSV